MSSDYRYFVVRINVTMVILSINAINIIMHIDRIDKRDVHTLYIRYSFGNLFSIPNSL